MLTQTPARSVNYWLDEACEYEKAACAIEENATRPEHLEYTAPKYRHMANVMFDRALRLEAAIQSAPK